MIPPLFQEILVSHRPHFHFLTALHKPSERFRTSLLLLRDSKGWEAIYLLPGRVSSVNSHFSPCFWACLGAILARSEGIAMRGHCDSSPYEGFRGPPIGDRGTFLTFSNSFYKTTSSSSPPPNNNPHTCVRWYSISIPETKLEMIQ